MSDCIVAPIYIDGKVFWSSDGHEAEINVALRSYAGSDIGSPLTITLGLGKGIYIPVFRRTNILYYGVNPTTGYLDQFQADRYENYVPIGVVKDSDMPLDIDGIEIFVNVHNKDRVACLQDRFFIGDLGRVLEQAGIAKSGTNWYLLKTVR